MSQTHMKTVFESLLLIPRVQEGGTFAKMSTNLMAGGKSSSPRTVDVYSRSDHSFFIHGTKYNVDLSDHGNATPGTPVTLWGKWGGENQIWRLEQA